MNTDPLLVVDRLADVLAHWPDAGRDALIPILQETQEAFGYLPREAMLRISQHLNLPASKVFGVATFYNQFRFQAPGRHRIQVCRGTACHVKGSAAVLEALCRHLKIQPGQTTKDGMFSVEVVACIGACGLAPVIAVDGEFHAGVTPDAVAGIVATYREPEALHA